ncbi:BTB/POZ domain-containing protein 7 [Bombina bombina]|uniref:BTB/POZ domain-containing protein 7 n=1 Tax=Bombina bombina TaxID=8345 RepID=UPI00235A9006|nr:BTB/POZ domain-containing protein 7 [Bombina bombina]
MGVNASSYPHSCSPRVGGNSQAQQTFIGTSSYSHQGYGYESKLYSLEHGHEKPQDKKKKTSGLATLKKKFIKRRKSSRSADHAKQMRELLSGWDVRDVNALVEEYEGTAALKELSLQANVARPEARTLQKDMADLYEYKYCTDVDLIFQETCFPVHRAILAARCPFFKKLLSSSPEYGAEIIMDINTAGIDMPMFSALLHYLYTGEFGIEDSRFQNVDILVQLSEEFGTPNSLDVDMRGLFDYMCYYDAVLSFSADTELVETYGTQSCLDEELRAHKAVLSARSPFFRNLLQRRIRTGEEITDRTLRTPTRIILDESIIPKKYAKVILHCMYTDIVDLSYVLHCSPSVGSLSEVQALVAGKPNMSRAEEAMELYHIALFLEFNMLAQGKRKRKDNHVISEVSDVMVAVSENPHKFFPDERFGDESPLLTVRQSGRCRINSTPATETMFTDIDSYVAFHPPLPPPPPPYHPPATPIHNQFKSSWKHRVPSQHPSRSFSYPCNHSLFHSRTTPKAAPPTYIPGAKQAPPDCTNNTGLGRQTVAAAAAAMAAEQQVCGEPVLNEFMPDIAMGVSTMSLKDRRLPELTIDTQLSQQVSEMPGPPQHISCNPSRHMHSARKKHSMEHKMEARESQTEYPDFYDFSNSACRPSTPVPSRHSPLPSQGIYFGPDLYTHSKANSLKSAYVTNQISPKKHEDSRREYLFSQDGHPHRQKNEPLHLDVLEQPPQRLDLALAAQENANHGPHHGRGRTKIETDLTYGLTSSRPLHPAYSSEIQDERSFRRIVDSDLLDHGAQRNMDLEREDPVGRERRSPNKQDFLYKKSAL